MNFYYSVHLPERLPGTSYRGAPVPDPPEPTETVEPTVEDIWGHEDDDWEEDDENAEWD